jgi:hypothetical protein
VKTITGQQFYALPEGTVFRWKRENENDLEDLWMVKGPATSEHNGTQLIKTHLVGDVEIPATPEDMATTFMVHPDAKVEVLEPDEITKIFRFWKGVARANPEPMIVPIGTPEKPKYQHIDDLLDNCYDAISDPALRYAYWFFTIARLPAAEKSVIQPFTKDIKLFVDYEGKTWRVTGASKFGDIYLTRNLNQDTGYEKRVTPDITKLSGWRSEPTPSER